MLLRLAGPFVPQRSGGNASLSCSFEEELQAIIEFTDCGQLGFTTTRSPLKE